MNVEILVACIAAVGSIVGVVIASVASSKKANQDILSKLENSQDIMNEKIETLTKTVEKHNQLIERTYKVEEKVTTLEREMSEVRSSIGMKGKKQ